MANWFYFNPSGEKIGPITSTALKNLAKQGLITPETVIENGNGRSSIAGNVNGLTFPESPPTPLTEPSSLSLSPSPPTGDNPFSSSSNPFQSSPAGQSPFTQPTPGAATAPGSFCTYCGQPVHPTAAVCMVCGANPRGHRKFCVSCGVPTNDVQVICTRCHTPIGGNVGNIGSHIEGAPKQRLTYVLLAVILLGGYGIHNFYAGRKSQAIAQLIIGVLGVIFTAGIATVGVWIWAIIEAITVKADGEGRPMV